MRQIASARVDGADGSEFQLVKSPSKAMKNGNGLYLGKDAIAGTMPHKKASLGSNEKLVPKLAVCYRRSRLRSKS